MSLTRDGFDLCIFCQVLSKLNDRQFWTNVSVNRDGPGRGFWRLSEEYSLCVVNQSPFVTIWKLRASESPRKCKIWYWIIKWKSCKNGLSPIPVWVLSLSLPPLPSPPVTVAGPWALTRHARQLMFHVSRLLYEVSGSATVSHLKK